jgi:hypothetical protein
MPSRRLSRSRPPASWLPLSRSPVVAGQETWKWPEHPKNLKVLPPDTGPEKLSAIMRGFTRSLGIRCQYCHVGEEGKPLSSFDFVSDANPNKDRARRCTSCWERSTPSSRTSRAAARRSTCGATRATRDGPSP